MSTPLSFTTTEIEIILYLFSRSEKVESYLYKIHKELDKSTSTVLGSLSKLEQKGLVKPFEVTVPAGKRAPTRYYNLTPFGYMLAQTLSLRDKMV